MVRGKTWSFYRAPTVMRPVSVARAYWIGVATVHGPVTLIMVVPFSILYLFGERLGVSGWLGFAWIVLPIAAAWLWWSLFLPRWRVWALERVRDPGELIERAVASGFMWPPGHFFERTEIRTEAIRERERAVGWS